MGDDSNVRVPLGFSFPYFGKTFTDSWMYSNGAVNFVGGNVPGGFCCSGQNLATLSDTGYNYSIVPLWTDLIAIEGGSHYTLGTSTSMTYGWYGVSEYYDSRNRSSFEVKIDNTGLVDVKFTGALISRHTVTSGLIGDISKGEYYQYYHGNGLNSGPFSYTLGGSPQDPCKDNYYSYGCPGYASTISANTSSVVAESPIVESPIASTPVETQAQQTTTTAPPVVQPIASQATSPVASTPVVQASAAPQQSKPGVSLSTILGIVSAEQSRISNVEKSVVQEAVSLALASSQSSVTSAESIAASAAASSGNGISVAAFGNQSSSKSLTLGSSFSMNAADRMIIDFMQERGPNISEQQSNSQNDSVKKNVQNNQLAGNVNIASIAVQPLNYNSYYVTMPDNIFYQPKEIYKNQRVIDNVRVLRQMSSDRLHKELVDLQYNNRGN